MPQFVQARPFGTVHKTAFGSYWYIYIVLIGAVATVAGNNSPRHLHPASGTVAHPGRHTQELFKNPLAGCHIRDHLFHRASHA